MSGKIKEAHFSMFFIEHIEPNGRVSKTGAPWSKGCGFNPRLGPILIDSKIFEMCVNIANWIGGHRDSS